MLSVMSSHEKIDAQEKPSSYWNLMKLPEKAKATKLNPLGPGCVITKTEVTDPEVLKEFDFYWWISTQRGCVECRIKKHHKQKIAATCDPICVITRKSRRIEAFCCTRCQSTFFTVVQALLHLKAIHRPDNKILVQDQDVFENSSSGVVQPKINVVPTSTFVLPPGNLESGTEAFSFPHTPIPQRTNPSGPASLSLPIPIQRKSPSPVQAQEKLPAKGSPDRKESDVDKSADPMISIINAITSEFKKQIKHLAFNEDCSEVKATFADGSLITAKTPDLTTTATDDNASPAATGSVSSEPIMFVVDTSTIPDKNDDELDAQGSITLRTNRPVLAREYFASKINVGASSEKPIASPSISKTDDDEPIDRGAAMVNGKSTTNEIQAFPTKPIVLNRPVKSVRFKLGAPDSSDEERCKTPEKHEPSSYGSSSKGILGHKESDDGLRIVVDDLLNTAGKGRIPPIPSTSPVATTSSLKPFVPISSIPQVGSSPALSRMAAAKSSKTGSLSRVQSWSSPVDNPAVSVEPVRRPYVSRNLTYAEKIKWMKQQNDYDSEFTTKHIRRNDSSSSEQKQGKHEKGIDIAALLSLEKTKAKETQDGKTLFIDSDVESNVSEDSVPPSMLNTSNAVAAAYSNFLLNAGAYSSEYYGSGEWANAAIELMKSLQNTGRAKEESPERDAFAPHSSANAEPFRDDAAKGDKVDGTSKKYKWHNTESSLNEPQSDDSGTSNAPAKHALKAKLSSRKRPKPQNELFRDDSPPKRRTPEKQDENVVASSAASVSPFVKLSSILEMPEHKSFDSRTSQTSLKPKNLPKLEKIPNPSPKVPLSPLLSSDEKNHIIHHQLPLRSPKSLPKSGEESVKNPIVSRLSSKNMGLKCPSDPALSSSSTAVTSVPSLTTTSAETKLRVSQTKTVASASLSSHRKLSDEDGTVLKAGDSLHFTEDVLLANFHGKKVITTKLKRAKEDRVNNKSMNLPQMSRACIETCVKIQCVQKVHVCKVCGFSVDVTNTDAHEDEAAADKLLHAHVMEHSLKDIYATGYEMPKL